MTPAIRFRVTESGALLVMAVPLYDMTSAIVIRSEGAQPVRGRSPAFLPSSRSTRLDDAQAVWTIDLVTLAGGAGALLPCIGGR